MTELVGDARHLSPSAQEALRMRAAGRDLAGDPREGQGRGRRGALHRPGHRPHLGCEGPRPDRAPHLQPLLGQCDVRDQHEGPRHFMVFAETFDATVMCRFLDRLIGHFDHKVHSTTWDDADASSIC
ncbi:hypothetical protein [Streptomyces dysideae]